MSYGDTLIYVVASCLFQLSSTLFVTFNHENIRNKPNVHFNVQFVTTFGSCMFSMPKPQR